VLVNDKEKEKEEREAEEDVFWLMQVSLSPTPRQTI